MDLVEAQRLYAAIITHVSEHRVAFEPRLLAVATGVYAIELRSTGGALLGWISSSEEWRAFLDAGPHAL